MTTNYPYSDPQFYGPPAAPPFPPADPTPPTRRRRRRVLTAGVAALAAAGLIGGVAVAESGSSTVAGSGSLAEQLPALPGGNGGIFPGGNGTGQGGNGGVFPGGNGTGPGGNGGVFPGGGSTGGGSTSGGTSTSASLATTAQQTGVVTVVSVLKYQNAESAGTGMILTSNGEILTNNHVVEGATSITVTVASTGRSYTAKVVGTDPTADVAVLQLNNASGLTTARVGNSSNVAVGNSVVGVGNAGGTGTLRASKGAVTALNQSITATDETGQNGEQLTGLIEVNAPIISGDSGGPLYNAAGQIVGMDTAASTTQATETAYAIPINTAVALAAQIESGIETSTIHIGLPAFIGVGVADTQGGGAAITSVLAGGPAANAGITAGSTITSVGGKKVTSAAGLKTVLGALSPGSSTSVSWTAANGSSHTATVTLVAGPAD
ncbi:MAG TPA: trypsin-like peptidase domain-containing protein, partial [Jatrophihabitans sp.]|nr:trypsin-like peptidase domain-containing protein [Jatrophihabitans sp.]